MSGIYSITRQQLVTGAFDWLTGAFQAVLLGPAYMPDYDVDATLADVPNAARLTPTLALTNLGVVNGYCFADRLVWPRLTTVVPVVALLVSSSATNQLIFLIDQGGGFGVTLTDATFAAVPSSAGLWRP